MNLIHLSGFAFSKGEDVIPYGIYTRTAIMAGVACAFIEANVCGEDIPVMEEVVVTAPSPERSLDVLGADIMVLSREDIARINAQTLPEALAAVASVDLVERGTPGSQADIAVNGSSGEGVLVLINGIRVRDPQTGHFSMDIPVDLSSVERIEVMDGGGSSIYGSSASGGVVNIVTAAGPEDVKSRLTVGSHNTGTFKLSFAKKVLGSHISAALRSGRSGGYRENSELRYGGGDMTGTVSSSNWSVKWNLGFITKGFGAGNFYAPYPSYEKTQTYQGGINAVRTIDSDRLLRIRAGGRGHGDNFLIEKEYLGTAKDYRNTHYNRTYNTAVEYLSNGGGMFYLVGAESEHTGISGSLGNHADYNNAVYGELTKNMAAAHISLSMRLDSGSAANNIFSPGFGMTIPLNTAGHFRLRAERAYRAPTYTDMYYKSYSNMGNPFLKPERSSSINTGFDTAWNNIAYGISVFARETDNAVDWVRGSDEMVWTVANHGELSTRGVKTNIRYSAPHTFSAAIGAAVLDQSVRGRQGIESKYTLNPLIRTVSATVTARLYESMNATVVARYEKPLHGESRVPVTVRLSRTVGQFSAVLGVRNLLDERYEEIEGLPAPGRWFELSMEHTINGN